MESRSLRFWVPGGVLLLSGLLVIGRPFFGPEPAAAQGQTPPTLDASKLFNAGGRTIAGPGFQLACTNEPHVIYRAQQLRPLCVTIQNTGPAPVVVQPLVSYRSGTGVGGEVLLPEGPPMPVLPGEGKALCVQRAHAIRVTHEGGQGCGFCWRIDDGA